MLKKLKIEECDLYIDFAYSLALDITKSGYPTFTDGIKAKENFINLAKRAFQRKDEEILLFIHEKIVYGWIHYYYLTTSAFLIEDFFDEAMEEFLVYIKDIFPRADLLFGFPQENKDATQYLVNHGFLIIEESYNNTLHFKDYEPLDESDYLVKITKENYDVFRQLHCQYDADMYWTCDKIWENFDKWHIYSYSDEECAKGYIMFNNSQVLAEIFAVGFLNHHFDERIFKQLLIKCLNVAKIELKAQHLVFFTNDEEFSLIKPFGFTFVSKYQCFRKKGA